MAEISCEFAGIIDIGEIVGGKEIESWKSRSNKVFRCGYIALRRIERKDNHKKLNIYCKIKKSSHGVPLFQCVAHPLENNLDNYEGVFTELESVASVTKLSASGATAEIFKVLGLFSRKRWSGLSFFGMSLLAYSEAVEAKAKLDDSGYSTADNSSVDNNLLGCLNDSLVNDRQKENENPVMIEDVDLGTSSTNRYVWVGVVSYGKYISNDNFLYDDIPLTVGFKSARKVVCESETVLVSCEIQHDDITDLPLYIRWTENFTHSHHKISVAVKNLLCDIKCAGKKNWSGFNFFELTRVDVKNVLVNMKPSPRESSKKDSILSEISNVRHRNAGPTSNLSLQLYKNNRNDLIHRVVDYTSFGDVKGISVIFYIYFKVLIISSFMKCIYIYIYIYTF